MLTAASFVTGASISTGVKEDRSNRWVIGALSLIGLLLAFFSACTDRLGLLVFGGNTLRWVGVVLFTVGGVLRLWPVFVPGPRLSGLVAIQEHHTLVTDGIYSRIRNPSYLGLLVNMLGWALTFKSGVGVLLTVLPFRSSLPASAPRSGFCAGISVLSTMATVPALGACFPGFIRDPPGETKRASRTPRLCQSAFVLVSRCGIGGKGPVI